MERAGRDTSLTSRRLYAFSPTPGALGGHGSNKGYGRLDCPSALRWIVRGNYVKHHLFFADEEMAMVAGYRPCAVCMPEKYAAWKAERGARRRVSEEWRSLYV